jgi:uncharacterized protein (DUF2147 family)
LILGNLKKAKNYLRNQLFKLINFQSKKRKWWKGNIPDPEIGRNFLWNQKSRIGGQGV